ncbi:MAG: hypothetical protein ACKOTE_03940 [Opitutaceae bacterium]
MGSAAIQGKKSAGFGNAFFLRRAFLLRRAYGGQDGGQVGRLRLNIVRGFSRGYT